MAIDKGTLDSMLDEWARFYLSEFNEVNWAKVSMSGKIIEFAQLGISVPGTKHEEHDFTIPTHIERVVMAITRLDLKYQHVIKEEYTGKGNQHRKSKNIGLSISRFRNRLFRARKTLMQII